jgi:hypothetical protein
MAVGAFGDLVHWVIERRQHVIVLVVVVVVVVVVATGAQVRVVANPNEGSHGGGQDVRRIRISPGSLIMPSPLSDNVPTSRTGE